jgi:hypothetical protein
MANGDGEIWGRQLQVGICFAGQWRQASLEVGPEVGEGDDVYELILCWNNW